MSDTQAAIQYILTVQVLGLISLPLSMRLFNKFPDQGWGMTKILGILTTAWLAWLASSLHILPFNYYNALIIIGLVALFNWFILADASIFKRIYRAKSFILLEELLFIGVFALWTYYRGWAPDINGLEKFMDYGFMLSSLKTKYFPPLDHFLASEPINYYYFGHYLAAFITLLSRVPASFGYNLQMSLIFALTAIQTFAIGASFFFIRARDHLTAIPWRSWVAGILTFLFIGVFGNLHTLIYYFVDDSTYWYPDATRFIKNTIHEFPIYSFLVNDLHGHVSDIPIVLLFIAVLSSFVLYHINKQHSRGNNTTKGLDPSLSGLKPFRYPQLFYIFVLALILGSMYATNAWDFAIYGLLAGLVFWIFCILIYGHGEQFLQKLFTLKAYINAIVLSLCLLILSILLFLPFWLQLEPITKGIGIVPLGGQSPLWQLTILWGVQVPLTIAFIQWLYRIHKGRPLPINRWIVILVSSLFSVSVKIDEPIEQELDYGNSNTTKLSKLDVFMLIMSFLSFLLILLPEIIYMKDIYPTHYRANTMFKFYYQAWIMLGIVSGVSVVLIWQWLNRISKSYGLIYKIMSIFLIMGAVMYPIIAIHQTFGDFIGPRQSIDGTKYLYKKLPEDARAIEWINTNISGQPAFIEAVGESYTDYARIAANTGNPSLLGWYVHEWLWRGDYSAPMRPTTKKQLTTGEPDSVASRVQDVQTFYETDDPQVALNILRKYDIKYIYIGPMEREKYPSINENKFADMNLTLVYDEDSVKIYKVNY